MRAVLFFIHPSLLVVLVLVPECCGKQYRLSQTRTSLVVCFMVLRMVLLVAFRERGGQESCLSY